MSCSPFDLREYFLKELPEAQSLQVEAHVRTCSTCHEELDRLVLTQAALFSLRDEEIPQRIAFVSDKIFEPSPWRRWWSTFWGSTARLGFASAAMLSVAILVSALTRPAPAPAVKATAPAAIAMTQDQVQQQIQAAVDLAVAQSEARQEQKTQRLVADVERRDAEERQQLIRVANLQIDYVTHRADIRQIAASDYGPPRSTAGDSK
ncbi:MAG TPA: hypothetical protein VG675_12745 [Bryobacteraceae bacterium]|nr:hypothetical protein [Bryobacteraceae bacterium]